jgi:hypothetical protein
VTRATVIPLGPAAERLVVEIDYVPPLVPTPAMNERWEQLAAANPRLFNGRILAFLRRDGDRIHARVESYQRMATQPLDEHAMTQLGVTGVLTAPGPTGTRAVLLGRRSASTHVYPGRWELAPSGGVDAPPPPVRRLTIADLRRQLGRELAEETGIDPAGLHMTPAALCHDPGAPSMDVVFRVELPAIPPRHATWEFDDFAWLDTARLPEQLAARSLTPTDPSTALLAWFGWMRA